MFTYAGKETVGQRLVYGKDRVPSAVVVRAVVVRAVDAVAGGAVDAVAGAVDAAVSSDVVEESLILFRLQLLTCYICCLQHDLKEYP